MRATSIILAAACVVACCATLSAKQLDSCLPRAQHPWGRFKIGSWKTVVTATETLDERGEVIGRDFTETTTKLVDVDDRGYTLRVDVAVIVAGKRFRGEPQVIRRGFSGECDGQTVSVKRVGQGRLAIAGRDIPCEIRQVTIDDVGSKRITTVHYSDRYAPYVLRRETTALDVQGNPLELQSQVDVMAVDELKVVQKVMRPTSRVRIMHQQGKASTLTLEVHCADVPGGVIEHTSKETDDTGRVIRRSTLELVTFQVGTGEDADSQLVRKAFHRARNRRAR